MAFHRIWSTDWFNNPTGQSATLSRVIEDRLAELKAKEAQFSRTSERMPINAKAVPPPSTPRPKPTLDLEAASKAGITENGMGAHRVSIGDSVRVRYLTDDKRAVQFTISGEQSDPSNGVIHFKTPIAEALLGAEEGDEVEILVGSYLRSAVLEKIVNRLH